MTEDQPNNPSVLRVVDSPTADPSPDPAVQTESKQPSPQQRAQACFDAIREACDHFGCRVATVLQSEPAGAPVAKDTHSKAILSAAWFVQPLAILLCFLLASCAGTMSAARIANERSNLALARELRDGWFHGKPIPLPQDQKLVDDALTDWGNAIDAEAAAAAPPSAGGR